VVAGVSENGEPWAEFAGDEGIEGAEAAGEFDGGDAAIAVQPAKKIGSGAAAFLGVALDTAGDEVAVGIVLQLNTRDNVVEATQGRGEATATIKTKGAFALVDGFAQRAVVQEVQLFEAGGESGA
jgi:hypothetical protein